MRNIIEYSLYDIKLILAEKHNVDTQKVECIQSKNGFTDNITGFRIVLEDEK